MKNDSGFCPKQNLCRMYMSPTVAHGLGCCLTEKEKKSVVCVFYERNKCLVGEKIK
jgi:hypothetical protein